MKVRDARDIPALSGEVYQSETERCLAQTVSIIERLVKHIEYLDERISVLSHKVYELAPEYEIIDSMADTDEERQAMLAVYMNHNSEWDYDYFDLGALYDSVNP